MPVRLKGLCPSCPSPPAAPVPRPPSPAPAALSQPLILAPPDFRLRWENSNVPETPVGKDSKETSLPLPRASSTSGKGFSTFQCGNPRNLSPKSPLPTQVPMPQSGLL